MSYTEHNISALSEYFASGCKKEKLLGLELEHFLVDTQTRNSLHYDKGVEKFLRRLQVIYGEPILSQGHIIGIVGENATITLEPAAQLEISFAPSHKLVDVAQGYDEFIDITSPILDDMGCELVCAGYHPKSKVDELPLIPKKRYEYMDSYFKTTGTRGKNMMKGSAATQVSIDYENEADFSKKFRVANILGPLLSLICDNTAVYEGERFRGNMARTYIWNDVDPDRSMVVKGALDEKFGFQEYAKYIYNTPAILIVENGEELYTGSKPISELYADRPMTTNDIEHVISMVFPDVRLTTHLEIRMADSIPIESSLAFMALLKGVFYDRSNLNELYQMTRNIRNHDVAAAKSELMKKGVNAKVYGRRAGNWIAEIFNMARNGLNAEELSFIQPMYRLVMQYAKQRRIV